MHNVSLPTRLWYDNLEREIYFPDHWAFDNLTSPGLEKPGMDQEHIAYEIGHPVEGVPLEELARGRKKAVIIFDDMTRPTPVYAIAPFVLDALHRAGMNKEQIRFIWALGAHGTYDMINARKKLGDGIVEQYAVYNHDAFQNTVRLGRTPTGVELWMNREVMSCDLKIGIGCITPHIHVGFGGGAKIMLPGVAGIETINQFHNQLYRDQSRTGLGNFKNNILRAECDAAGEMAGLDFKVDVLLNRRGRITDLFAGPFKAAHAVGGKKAREHYGIAPVCGYDIAVSNAYAKVSEAAISLRLAVQVLRKDGAGTAVLVIDAPEGQVPHYVMGGWGNEYGGRHFGPKVKGEGVVGNVLKKLIILSPNPHITMFDWISHRTEAVAVGTWPEVLSILEKEYPGDAKVAVIPDGTMQYMKSS